MNDQQSIFDDPLTRARELKAKGHYESAYQVLTQALLKAENDPRLKASLADLYYRWGKYREALSIAGQLLAHNSDDHRALVVVGNTLLARKKPDEALEYFKLACNIAPTDYIWGRIAKCHIQKKRPQAALAALNEAEDLAGPTPRLLALRAKCFEMLGEDNARHQELLRAARLVPDDPQDFFMGVWPILEEFSPREAASVSKDFRDECNQSNNPHLLLFEVESLIKCKDYHGASERLKQLRSADTEERIQKAARILEERIEQKQKNTKTYDQEAG